MGSHDDDEDAGVSKAMAREFDLDKRIDLLLIHSMVHLLGYDHESPEEWKEMTLKGGPGAGSAIHVRYMRASMMSRFWQQNE